MVYIFELLFVNGHGPHRDHARAQRKVGDVGQWSFEN